jgi:hypothetical protein
VILNNMLLLLLLLLLLLAEPSKLNGLVTVSCTGNFTPGMELDVGVNVTAAVQGCSDLHGNITSEWPACADPACYREQQPSNLLCYASCIRMTWLTQ